MIKSIKTQNFESHSNTKIALHPGTNVFIGESDEGKSGIIRQIKWNSRNRPQGDSYRSDQLDSTKKEDRLIKTSVAINYQNSGHVTRARNGVSGGINTYQINNNEPLRALRADIPDEVQEITRIKDVNIQGQHPSEQYFLLADNPRQVAKKFNQVTGLTIMDDALQNINSQIRTCNTEINISKDSIEKIETELQKSKWILRAEKVAKKLQVCEQKIHQKRTERNTINEIISDITNINVTLEHYDGIEIAKNYLNKLSTQKQQINIKEERILILQETILTAESLDLALRNSSDTTIALNMLKSLEKLQETIQKKEYKVNEISLLLRKIKTTEDQFQKADKNLISAVKEKNKIRENTKCPICGRTGK